MPNKIPDNEVILAIDPGNVYSAYCFLQGRKIGAFGKVLNADVRDLVHESVYDHIVIEQIASYGMPVGKEVFETCIQIGRLFERARLTPTLLPRLQVKMAICHSTRANDSTIRAGLLELFGPAGTKKAPGATYGITKDVWAALALAETFRTGDFTAAVLSENSPS